MSEIRYPLIGEIDLASAPQLRANLKLLVDIDGVHLLIDCSELTFIASSGVAVLLEANEKLESDGRHMLIVNVQRSPRRVFEALGLTDLFRYEREPAPS